MAMFFLLNGMGVVFLLFVLVNFWNEGHRPKEAIQQHQTDFTRRVRPEVLVVTRPISRSARGSLIVIPLQVQERGMHAKQPLRRSAGTVEDISIKSYSKR